MNLITSLCQLAAGGRAVVTTIHQPSSRLYQQLDKLLLLSEGPAMYYGEKTRHTQCVLCQEKLLLLYNWHVVQTSTHPTSCYAKARPQFAAKSCKRSPQVLAWLGLGNKSSV